VDRRQPSIRQLRYLLALDEHQHFGRAAVACFVSQSAFSIAIRQLEEILDTQLFERDKRQLRITESGRVAVRQAREVMDRLDNLVQTARGRSATLESRLKTGVIPTIAPFLMPKVIPDLRRQFPALELLLTEDRTDVLHEGLLDGEFDLIIVALPWDLPATDREVLFRDRFFLAGRRDSPLLSLARKGLKKLPDESVMLLEDGHCLRDHALAACRRLGRSQDSRMQAFAATSIHTLLQMVAQGLGVTFVPEMALADPTLGALPLGIVPLEDQAGRDIALAWRRGSAGGDDYRRLGAAIRTAWTKKSRAPQRRFSAGSARR
jgi:LysR family hydrogen peroxide-inducible transcriptional activator